jgi:hypothetical protein
MRSLPDALDFGRQGLILMDLAVDHIKCNGMIGRPR